MPIYAVIGIGSFVLFMMISDAIPVAFVNFLVPLAVLILLWKYIIIPVMKKLIAWSEHANRELRNSFTDEEIQPIRQKLNSIYTEYYKHECNKKLKWGLQLFGNEFFNSAGLKDLSGFVASGRADSLKEAINLYDENAHRENMENMQRIIQDVALVTAENSAETAQKAAEAATAAKISALLNYGTYRNTKKIKKSLK